MKSSLNGQSILLLGVDGLFVLAGALSGTFLNVYLWKTKPDFAMIGWFTFSQQLFLGLTFWIAGKWVKEHNKMNALRVGTALTGLFYLIVLWAGKDTVHFIWPLGLLLGAALGLFWLAFNVVYFEVTDSSNRDLFNGWTGLIGSATGIVGPWLSGWIISTMHGERGYRFIFTVSLVIYGIGVVLSFFLKKREVSGVYSWSEPLKQIRNKGNPWRQAVPGLAFQGIREGVFAFLINLLVYIATTNEMKLGQFSLITSLVALISYWAAGKWFKKRNRSLGMIAGSICLLLVILPLLWKVNYGTLLFLGIGTSIFVPLYTIPMVSSVFDLMGTSEHSVDLRVELVVLRELSLMVGRIVGILIFIGVLSIHESQTTITWLMIVLGATPIFNWIVMRRLLGHETKAA
ncbi:MFS transporter [Paenibacillus sediminis]|uniref:YQGE family putative transporter n=1 Tax=Paenibacillus sediminis TaxID=664909 RepID=A0ABS4H4Y3_9BACL|nr:MFS transporter [Paenibacillus sediminis]MBP1937521.1 YQGE family putative transporter [Paenibacillus sediminis]